MLLGHEAPFSRALRRHLDERRGGWKPFEIRYADEGQRMFNRAVAQVRARVVISGHHHVWMKTASLQFAPGGESWNALSVILDRDGKVDSMAVLGVNERSVHRLVDLNGHEDRE